MPVIFSKACEYALQATLFLARQESEEPIHLQDIASALHIPRHFLSKILQTLTHYEIIHSYRGHQGGFKLARPASSIKSVEIVRAIDGDTFLSQCVLGFPGCGDDHPCPMHSYWKEAKQTILTMLNEQTIGDLSKEIDDKLALLHLHSRQLHRSTQ